MSCRESRCAWKLVARTVRGFGGSRSAARVGLVAMLASAALSAHPAVSTAGTITAAPGATADQTAQLNRCLSMISETAKRVKAVGEVLDAIKSPSNKYNVTISFTNVMQGDDTVPTDRNAAYAGKGKGSGTTVGWNPDDKSPFIDDPTVSVDPCAALVHELSHAYDAAKGDWHQDEDHWPGTLIPYDDVIACRLENEYRAANGLDKRQRYVDALPPYAVDLGTSGPLPEPIRGPKSAGGSKRLVPSGNTGNTGGGTTGGGNTGNTGGGTTGGGNTGNTGGGSTGGGTTGGGNTGNTGNTGGGNTGNTGNTGGGSTGGGTTGGGNTGNTGGGTTGGGTNGGGNSGAGSTGAGTSGGGQ